MIRVESYEASSIVCWLSWVIKFNEIYCYHEVCMLQFSKQKKSDNDLGNEYRHKGGLNYPKSA